LLTAKLNGILLIVLGAVAMIAPLFSPVWGLPAVGAAIFLSGIIELADAWYSDSGRTHYSSGVFSVLAGALISFESAFAFSGLMVAVSLLLLLDGGTNIVRAARGRSAGSALWDTLNGAANLLLALVVWWLRDTIGPMGFGFFLAVRMAASGWQVLAMRRVGDVDQFDEPEDAHPDRALGLPPHPIIGFIHREAVAHARSRTPTDFYWSVVFVVVFLAIHIGRLDAEWTLLGLLTPAAATLGDIVAALVLSVVVLLPLELLWRRVSRPIERAAWQRMLSDATPEHEQPWSERAVRWWAEQRLRRSVARDLENDTLHGAVRQLIRGGLPVTAVLIAVHPVWGFSWYFNSENWATAAWQKIAETRVDEWRQAMIEAVARAHGADGPAAAGLFEVSPAGIREGDFSFVVIGDPGEGDSSQLALRDQVLLAARRDAVKFIVIASDVVYPLGEMRDYEPNFYLPLMGVDKPVLAIPGNHDWFNALDGFAANLMEPAAARAAIEARVRADLSLSSTTSGRTDRLIATADRLRSVYRLRAGLQRAPFFELHAGGFSLLAIDTGIERRIDPLQMAWLRAALQRATGTFTMAILGHPFVAAGRSQIGDGAFKELHDLLRAHDVRVMMAGDTHDLEYYPGERAHYFVNGGGGAYLSIGTSLNWPGPDAPRDYAFYPRTDAVAAKLDAETPWWKWPAWWWIRRHGAWPFSVEALSAVFDFNRAPFYQSFVEVRVERSRGRVVFALFGVDGPLRWQHLQTGGAVVPAGQPADALAEIVLPLSGG
jgi:uncharacterized membrane protein HdeD (DUF308 family)